jgi:transposase
VLGQPAYRHLNQIRAFLLERNIAVRQGLRFLRAELPGILARRTDILSPRMSRVIEELAGDWRHLDTRIDGLSGEIETLAHQDPHCERLMTVPGIGPIISSAMVAAIGTGDVFSKGRDFGAWLGLVPKQISTGDRTVLGSRSKRGNRYLRVLFVMGQSTGSAMGSNLGLKRRLHDNVLAIALANKLARIAWAVPPRNRELFFSLHLLPGALISCLQIGIVEGLCAGTIDMLNFAGNHPKASAVPCW